tara:strand:+ start:463 stop:849 length:387 start_codon:yes stop_codon:yes gene_type:complete
MKHLLLSLTLIISANAWADDEFPIELTCELGSFIILFQFDKTEELSWWTPHSSTESGGRWGAMFANDNFKNKKNKLNRYVITDSAITFRIRSANEKSEFILNRYSLKVNSPTYHGQCYKGFKEYEKQI